MIFGAEGATGLKPKFGLVLRRRPSSSISWRFLQRKEPDCPAFILFRYSDAEPKAEDENDDEDEDDWGRKEASSESHTAKSPIYYNLLICYISSMEPLFDYEKLDVYRVELAFMLGSPTFWAMSLNRRSNTGAS